MTQNQKQKDLNRNNVLYNPYKICMKRNRLYDEAAVTVERCGR